ncbi:MAG: ArsR/SmtB family transcription factor [Caulobacterales bacterium]
MSAAARRADAGAEDERLDRILAALADPHRRKVVDVLRHGPRPAGEIAKAVGLAPPAMSRHLRTLRRSGLVEESHPEFDARVRIYALRSEPMTELKRWLEETEAMWSEQLAAFKAHLEKGAA